MLDETAATPLSPPPSNPPSNPPSEPGKKDGRAKPRTEKQLKATEIMKQNRHKKVPALSDSYSPDSVALADVWYSNHELAKENRRKRKMSEMENLITSRLDVYHSKLMEDLQKPLSGFLDRYIDEYLEDVPQTIPKANEAARAPSPEFEEPPPLPRSKTSYLRPPAKQSLDFSRFF